MSSNTNSNNNSSSTSTPSVMSDWTTIPDAQLNWDNNNMEEHKKIQEAEEHKHWEEKEHHKAEEAEQRCKAEEARACAAAEEKQKCKEATVKDQFHNPKCLRCAKNNLPCEVVMGMKKRLACMGCTKLKEKCKKKKRVRKSIMADDKVVVEGWKMRQPEAGGNDMVAEAIRELTRELTGRLDMLTSGVLEELQGQSNMLKNLVKTQQNLSQKMSWHYTILEDMLGELEVFAANPGELLEEEDAVDEEDLEEERGELEGLGPIVNIEEEMEREQQGKSQDKGKGKERVE
ncbi:hypothetical protein ID866_11407 [Astraeus odoratus]|nr:hypothetical protein ID866_11407 [Astraeus odoratus]